jgi:hypothetical protein
MSVLHKPGWIQQYDIAGRSLSRSSQMIELTANVVSENGVNIL